MRTDELEKNVLSRLAYELRQATTVDTVNKLYRQARIWARFHCIFGDGCSTQRTKELYTKIKYYRDVNIDRLIGKMEV